MKTGTARKGKEIYNVVKSDHDIINRSKIAALYCGMRLRDWIRKKLGDAAEADIEKHTKRK